jgi:hypothetical protein
VLGRLQEAKDQEVGNVSDDEAEPAPLGVKRAQRSAKKAETEGRAPLATKAGRTAVRGRSRSQGNRGDRLGRVDDQEAGVDARGRVGRKTARAMSAMRTAQQLH